MNPFLPGAKLGVLGSGQLGRMFALAARRMGYEVATYSPEKESPTGQVADQEVVAPYTDLKAIREFAYSVDVVTFEFENIPSATVEAMAEIVPVRPAGSVLHIAQHRGREKEFLSHAGFPVTPFQMIRTEADLTLAAKRVGFPAVLKTAGFGYDGKGQTRIQTLVDAEKACEANGRSEMVWEQWIPFSLEVSVVGARDEKGNFVHWGVIENSHRDHILDLSISPARVSEKLQREATEMARKILESLGVIGVLCVEFFVTPDQKLLVNEIAPRPHNSGHLTIEASVTSQFEQQVRAVCGLSFGATTLVQPAAMANLLGDLWKQGEPNWKKALDFSDVKLHLYGKSEARAGRKMGHLTALAETAEAAAKKVIAARAALTQR
jgi:5-(carboxyamino)imidazole ribonucleotide synthase